MGSEDGRIVSEPEKKRDAVDGVEGDIQSDERKTQSILSTVAAKMEDGLLFPRGTVGTRTPKYPRREGSRRGTMSTMGGRLADSQSKRGRWDRPNGPRFS